METPKTLQEAIKHFGDYDNCRKFMISVRWLDGKVRCPSCDSEKVTFLEKARLYKCYGDHPRPKFSLKVGTVFEDSPIALEKWLPAVWLVVNCKNGVSSWEIHRALGVTQKTAWFMLHRIRLALQKSSFVKVGGPGSECEVDETFIGGKARNMHKSVRDRRISGRGKSVHDKTVVMGILERGGQVRTHVVPDRKGETLQPLVRNHVESGAAVFTDELHGYWGLDQEYQHQIIDHAVKYVDGRVHTNGLENFWSLLKRGLGGTYVSVEPFHLFRYLDEQAFRFNNRATKDNPLNDADRFSLALSQIVGKRLTYDELTGKTAERPL
jgi:transposase-like protein